MVINKLIGEYIMKIEGKDKKALWFENNTLYLIDQRKLPFSIEIVKANTVQEIAEIIKTMVQFDVYSNDDQCLIEAGRAILRKAQEK